MNSHSTLSENIHKIIQDISNSRDKIKDDFCRMYLAHVLPEGATGDWIANNIELVEEWGKDRLSVRWYFREKQNQSSQMFANPLAQRGSK